MHEAKELINRAINQDAPVYTSEQSKEETDKEKRSGFYKHLMNGVSNMLPFVVGGGILIALSFFWGINSANPYSPEYNEFAAMLNTIGSEKSFFLLVPVLAGFIASSIADRSRFAPGMVSGLIAIIVSGAHGAECGLGFLGGMIACFLAAYVTLLINTVFVGLPYALEGLKSVLFYPLSTIAITVLIKQLLNP